MNETDFWAIMSTARRGSIDRRIRRIAQELSRSNPEHITGFADQLAHPALPQRQTVRRGRKLVRIEVFRPSTGFSGAQHTSEPEAFRADLLFILKMVQQKLDLPEMPPLPPAPELPADI